MNISLKKFLYDHSGIFSISTLQNMIDIIQPDIIEDTIKMFLGNITTKWIRPSKTVKTGNSIKFSLLTKDIRARTTIKKINKGLKIRKTYWQSNRTKYAHLQKQFVCVEYICNQLYVSCTINDQTNCTP